MCKWRSWHETLAHYPASSLGITVKNKVFVPSGYLIVFIVMEVSSFVWVFFLCSCFKENHVNVWFLRAICIIILSNNQIVFWDFQFYVWHCWMFMALSTKRSTIYYIYNEILLYICTILYKVRLTSGKRLHHHPNFHLVQPSITSCWWVLGHAADMGMTHWSAVFFRNRCVWYKGVAKP